MRGEGRGETEREEERRDVRTDLGTDGGSEELQEGELSRNRSQTSTRSQHSSTHVAAGTSVLQRSASTFLLSPYHTRLPQCCSQATSFQGNSKCVLLLNSGARHFAFQTRTHPLHWDFPHPQSRSTDRSCSRSFTPLSSSPLPPPHLRCSRSNNVPLGRYSNTRMRSPLAEQYPRRFTRKR